MAGHVLNVPDPIGGRCFVGDRCCVRGKGGGAWCYILGPNENSGRAAIERASPEIEVNSEMLMEDINAFRPLFEESVSEGLNRDCLEGGGLEDRESLAQRARLWALRKTQTGLDSCY